MPEQLKIIIDADVNKAITGVKELSKVISLDFAKSTAAAATAANKLSSDVAASVQKIQTSLDSIKVKPIEISVASKGETAQLSELTKKLSGNVVVGVDFDTAVLNSEINNLNKKLQAGIDLTVNTQGARARVRELLAEISKLKEREVLLRADNKPVLNSITEVEAVLKRIQGNIRLSADVTLINAQIKDIQSKFAALVDPEINVLANTEVAETKIKELLSDLSSLKSSEIFIRANDTQAIKVINEVEAELNSLVGKQLNLSVTADLSKLDELKAKLSALKVTPVDVSVNTSGVDASIKNIQAKFNALVDPQINVLANTELAEVKIKDLLADLSTLKGSEIFIRANDAQALAVINEVETELKGILDKQINITVDPASVAQASKLISGDFVKATEKASVAGFNLSERIAAATIRINASIDKMVADALGETNKLKAGFQGFKTDFGVLTFDSSKALADVQKLKDQLNSVRATPVTIPVNTTSALERINLLEKELLNLQTLSVDPKISSTQLSLFEANIKRVKAEIASLKGQGVVVPIAIDTAGAQAKLTTLSETIETIRAKIEARKFFITTETDITKIAAYNKEIDRLEAKMRQIQNVGKKGFELFVVPNQTIQSVKNLTASVAAFGGGVRSFIPPAISSFSRLSPSINSAANSLQKLPNAANASSFAMLNFGRVIQDAPFGILGIANNLNPLIESLQRASVAAKQAGTSLGANLVGALTGPAGIGIAVSAVSSLLIVFGDKLFGAGKALSAAEIEANKFALSINNIKEGIDFFFANLDFENRLDKLKNKLKFGDAAEIFNFGLDKASADKMVSATNKEISDAASEIARDVNNSAFVLSKSGQRLAQSFLSSLQTGVEVPQELIDKLTKNDKVVFKRLNENALRIQKFTEENTKARRLSAETDVQIEIRKAEDLKKALEKQKDAFEKFQNDVIARAKQFNSEFGSTFVLPDLEETFFVNKAEVFKRALKELGDVQSFLQGNIKALKIKIPIQADFELLPITEPTISQSTIDGFFKDFGGERIDVKITPNIILDKTLKDEIDKKLDLKKQFSVLGDLGLKEFNKLFEGIDTNNFAQLSKGIEDATSKLRGMMDIALTLQQSIGQGLTNAFNSVFDAVLEGKNVFKALAEGIKQLIIGTIKAIAQMLILRAVTSFIFPGAAAGGLGAGLIRGIGGAANFGQLSGIGSRAFNNVIQIVGDSRLEGSTIVTSYRRETGSQGRFGG